MTDKPINVKHLGIPILLRTGDGAAVTAATMLPFLDNLGPVVITWGDRIFLRADHHPVWKEKIAKHLEQYIFYEVFHSAIVEAVPQATEKDFDEFHSHFEQT